MLLNLIKVQGKVLSYLIGISPLIAYVILLIYTDNLHSASSLPKLYPEYLVYYKHLPTAMAIIVGLIGVLSIFYLGKSHDHIREYLRYQSKLDGIVEKLKRTYNDKDERSKKDYFRKLDNTILDYEKLGGYVTKSRKIIIMLFLSILIIFGYVLFLSFNEQNTIQINFIKLALALVMLTAQFLIFWFIYEGIMSLHQSSLRMISRTVEKFEALF